MIITVRCGQFLSHAGSKVGTKVSGLWTVLPDFVLVSTDKDGPEAVLLPFPLTSDSSLLLELTKSVLFKDEGGLLKILPVEVGLYPMISSSESISSFVMRAYLVRVGALGGFLGLPRRRFVLVVVVVAVAVCEEEEARVVGSRSSICASTSLSSSPPSKSTVEIASIAC